MRSRPPHVLMVYPRFSPNSFWNYRETCKVVGARYSAAPLGFITVAALLPPDWPVRLVNQNTSELGTADLEWADMVMTGGMLPQQPDALEIMATAQARGLPVVVGGPDVTSSPHIYDAAEFKVLGEAEEILGDFVRAWREGAAGGTFRAEGFPDVTRSPVPRFDLLDLDDYMHVGVQISRGCPFTCEFCNVIELNGRVPRVKSWDQVRRELTALYDLGYRGHVDFVDDNLIGNRRVVKPILAELAAWLDEHGYPFEFSTEASINLADDEELLGLMRRAGFFAIFVGIETPDVTALLSVGKRQNARRDLVASVRRIHRAGVFVNAGFIIGFDAESPQVAETMIDCIEAAAIPVCMVGLLYALPNTRLFSRLAEEGRLHAGSDTAHRDRDADQCSSGLNFVTVRPRREVIEDYRTVLRRIYEPRAFFARTSRMARDLDLSAHRVRRPFKTLLRDLRSFARISWRNGVQDSRARGPYWRALAGCLLTNPRAIRTVVSQAALYLHLHPFSVQLDRLLAERIESIDASGAEIRASFREPAGGLDPAVQPCPAAGAVSAP
jgi:radical SAM superfamily enzyme YgiQ (UPF0313 family)